MQKLSKSEYLEKAKQHAISKGGVCLSDEYVNAKTKMEFKCGNEGHSSWLADCDHIINRGRWCPECAGERAVIKDGYEQAMSYAKSKGGLVLVPKDKGIKLHTHLTWKCKNPDHKSWSAEFRNTVKLGTWCPLCAGRFSKEEYLQKAKDYAISKGGICLSDKYENQNTKLKFKCSEPNHKTFSSVFDKLVNWERWCKECKPFLSKEVERKNYYLEKAKQHAISKGGKCLSTQYVNSNSKLEWKCSNTHKTWKSTYQNTVGILNRWCPECAGQFTPSEQLEKAKEYAKNKGGECLSDTYEPKTKLMWKCRELDHKIWSARLSSVMNSKNSTWCPECGNSIYYKENNTRVILEFLLGFELKKARVSWNINPETNHALELDGYNKEKKFAFEFQGRHHFEENVYKSASLEDVQKKDKAKIKNCLENNVFLLLINDKKDVSSLEDLINYIIKILTHKNIKFNTGISIQSIVEKVEIFNKISLKNESLKKAQEYAISRGGKCLSLAYINSTTKLEWKCNNALHPSWLAVSYISKSNSWCPHCKRVKN